MKLSFISRTLDILGNFQWISDSDLSWEPDKQINLTVANIYENN